MGPGSRPPRSCCSPAGGELFTAGFLPGETLEERLALVTDPFRVRPLIGELRARMNAFLRRTVGVVRERFGEPVSYASLPLEGVDWAPFDIVATDAAYRSAVTAANFRDSVRAFVAQGRAQGRLRPPCTPPTNRAVSSRVRIQAVAGGH